MGHNQLPDLQGSNKKIKHVPVLEHHGTNFQKKKKIQNKQKHDNIREQTPECARSFNDRR